jgi:asparagine synthase (glutamine-hydrolysing)
VLDPVNSVLKRLNVPGYRHYHRFDHWMREQLLASVEEILCDDRTRRRGVFNSAGIDDLLAQTRRGTGDHAYLLQILLVLELWQRRAEAA